MIQSYSLRYLRRDNGLYQRMAFVDMSMESSTFPRRAAKMAKHTTASTAVTMAMQTAQRMAFVDMSMERAMLREMMGSYLVIALAAFLLLLGEKPPEGCG